MSDLTGTSALLRLALRRDRIVLPAWVLGMTALVLSTAASFRVLFQTPGEMEGLVRGFGANPAFRALYGPPYDLTTVGGATAWRIGSNAALVAGLMSLLLVVRHTRADEESGRSELLGSTAVGRYAGLAAALAVAVLANAAVAVLIAVGLVAVGEPVGGAVSLGLSISLVGCVFAGVAAGTAQVASTARSALGSAGALLVTAYLVRDIASLGDSGLVWASPFGWAQEVRPFAGDRWLSLLPLLAAFALLVGVATRLAARRDLGSGLVASRAGPAEARPSLRGPLSLAWRLQRGLVLGWLTGVVLVAALLGGIAEDVRTLLDDSPQLAEAFRRMGGDADIADAYLSAMLSLLAIAVAGCTVQVVLRLRAEETSGRAEPVLAAPVSRTSWSASHLVVALVAASCLLLAAGLACGVADGARKGDIAGRVPDVLVVTLGQLPAVLTLTCLAFALAGLLPRWSQLAWVALAACILAGQLATGLGLPGWVGEVSPFAHTPQLPLTGGSVPALVLLLATAAALALLGVAGVRRRDLST